MIYNNEEKFTQDTVNEGENKTNEDTIKAANEKSEDEATPRKAQREIDKLKKENERLSLEIKEQNEKYLRMLAEYDNYRRRAQKEKESVYTDAYIDVLKVILPVVDNLERALAFTDIDKVQEGLGLILAQLNSGLKSLGIEEIENKKFDPNLHNAVMHIEDEKYSENEIVEVLQKGYKKGEKIIRYSMVKVAN